MTDSRGIRDKLYPVMSSLWSRRARPSPLFNGVVQGQFYTSMRNRREHTAMSASASPRSTGSYGFARSSTLKWLLLMSAVLSVVAPTASAQFNGIGGYDLKSTSDQAFAFDYNGTGNLDHIVLYRPGTGTIFIEEKQNGGYVPVFMSFDGIGGYDLKVASDRIIAFDYTGNGHADHLLCYRPGTGTVWILANQNGEFYPVYNSVNGIGGYDLKSTADRIISFDYDGNGKYDHLVLYRPGTGTVFILQNTNGTFTNEVVSFNGIGGYDLMSPNDRLIAFDYYSIGTADHLLAYRPGNGIAFVLENTNGSGNFTAVQTSFNGIGGYDLKVPTDRLVAYDYSGMGNQDHLLAYRPGSGVAFVIQSAYFAYSPVFMSSNGIGGYDLKSTEDKVFTFDYNSTGYSNTLALYRPGSSDFFIETTVGGNFTDLARKSAGTNF